MAGAVAKVTSPVVVSTDQPVAACDAVAIDLDGAGDRLGDGPLLDLAAAG